MKPITGRCPRAAAGAGLFRRRPHILKCRILSGIQGISIMSRRFSLPLGIAALLLLSACTDNQYGPPEPGKPLVCVKQYPLNQEDQ